MTLCWIIGRGGLLGSALAHALNQRSSVLYTPAVPFAWHDEAKLNDQIAVTLSEFAARARQVSSWEIYWAAGIGAMGSLPADLSYETAAWKYLLTLTAANDTLRLIPGRVAFASSAGAIYAGLSTDVINESCDIAPTTPYAFAKLEQERQLEHFVKSEMPIPALIARISTLYGPGQAGSKRRGLIAHMAGSIVRNRPIQIFVPFDTVRDYIVADDAAAVMVETLRARCSPSVAIHIVASGRPTTIAEIVGTFRRIARRPPLIATSASRLSALYLRRVQFRSFMTLPTAAPKTSLPVGIAQVLAAERLYFARGS